MTTRATQILLVQVRFFDGSYHGEPEWPPAPARLFQALVAAAGNGRGLTEADAHVLAWLERLAPPTIAAPCVRRGRTFVQYVPNNDLDAKGGDPALVSKIRVGKDITPKLFERDVPFIYGWPLPCAGKRTEDDVALLDLLARIADDVFQLGRGIDPAWAIAGCCSRDVFEMLLRDHPGEVLRPGAYHGTGTTLDCPQQGSLASLVQRHQINSQRLQAVGTGGKRRLVLQQAPRPRFASVEYGRGPIPLLLSLRPGASNGETPSARAHFASWPLVRAHELVFRVRDAANERLASALPRVTEEIRHQIVGRRPDEGGALPPEQRVQIIPLPSIGSEFADLAVRRLLVQIPHDGAIAPDDLAWAFSALHIVGDDGIERELVITNTGGDPMLRHFGVGTDRGRRRWRTVTPIVLPHSSARNSTRRRDGAAVLDERAEAERALSDALRHARVHRHIVAMRLQREPIDARGAPSRCFAAEPRFGARRLWHAEVELSGPWNGPLVLGDGRYLGLGVLAPLGKETAPFALQVVSGLTDNARPEGLVRALRRALLACAQDVIGPRRSLPSSLSGHEADGSPARGHRHLHVAWDVPRCRFLVIPPASARDAALLAEAIRALTTLRAGSAGVLALCRAPVSPDRDPLLAPSCCWGSVVPYAVCRHAKAGSADAAVAADVRLECRRSGLPAPKRIAARDVQARPGHGLRAHVEIEFDIAVPGPLTLGRTRHMGGGLFEHFDCHSP